METILFAIECDATVSMELEAQLRNLTKEEIVLATKNNFDGSPETVLQIVQIVSSLAAALTPVLTLYLMRKQVKKIKLGSIEIENPTKEQWTYLWAKYLEEGASDPNAEK